MRVVITADGLDVVRLVFEGMIVCVLVWTAAPVRGWLRRFAQARMVAARAEMSKIEEVEERGKSASGQRHDRWRKRFQNWGGLREGSHCAECCPAAPPVLRSRSLRRR